MGGCPPPLYPQFSSFLDKPFMMNFIIKIQSLAGRSSDRRYADSSYSIYRPDKMLAPKLRSRIKYRDFFVSLWIGGHTKL